LSGPTVAGPRPAARDPAWREVRAAAPGAGLGPGHARITFLGHSTVLIEVDDLRILTDPVLRSRIGPVRRQVAPVDPATFADIDAIFISHGHHDHLDMPSLRLVPGRPTIIVPRGLARVVARAGLGPIEEVTAGDRLLIDRVRVEVIAADHPGGRALGPSSEAVGCLVAGSVGVYFAGDTDVFAGMSGLAGRVDVALLPIWGWGPWIGPGHMDAGRAAEATAIIRPRTVIPVHWATLFPAGLRRLVPDRFGRHGSAFEVAVRRLAPEVRVRVLEPGEGWLFAQD
jgi:L-ascorbate metabolism protein UlaG (beta-lactamase superfamily)